MTTERRQSSPEYRERVHREAERLVTVFDHDYEAALEYVQNEARGDVAFLADLDTLLTRRAMTVKGATV